MTPTKQTWLFSPMMVLALFLVTANLLVTPVCGWTCTSLLPSRTKCASAQAAVVAASSALFAQPRVVSKRPRALSTLIFAGEKDESEDTEADASVSSEVASPPPKDDEEESFGVVKTILLAGPLFVKFIVVLFIKLVTDLIVFPLLWLYRLARMTKRRFLKMIGKGSREYPNGEPGP